MPTMATGFSPGIPGFTAARTSHEASVLAQAFFLGDVKLAGSSVIASTAVDSANSPSTSILRPGLVMAKLDSDGSWTNYDPDGSGGAQEARGILITEVNLINPVSGAAAARMANAIALQGMARTNTLIGLDQRAKMQLAARGFTFDDDTWVSPRGIRRQVAKTADYTVLAADHGTLFTTYGAAGAVAFTLPAIAHGLYFEFLNLVDQNMTVSSAEADNVILAGDLSGDSVAFSTASEKIGAMVSVEAIYVGTTLKWLVRNISAPKTATGGGSTATTAT